MASYRQFDLDVLNMKKLPAVIMLSLMVSSLFFTFGAGAGWAQTGASVSVSGTINSETTWTDRGWRTPL